MPHLKDTDKLGHLPGEYAQGDGEMKAILLYDQLNEMEMFFLEKKYDREMIAVFKYLKDCHIENDCHLCNTLKFTLNGIYICMCIYVYNTYTKILCFTYGCIKLTPSQAIYPLYHTNSQLGLFCLASEESNGRVMGRNYRGKFQLYVRGEKS